MSLFCGSRYVHGENDRTEACLTIFWSRCLVWRYLVTRDSLDSSDRLLRSNDVEFRYRCQRTRFRSRFGWCDVLDVFRRYARLYLRVALHRRRYLVSLYLLLSLQDTASSWFCCGKSWVCMSGIEIECDLVSDRIFHVRHGRGLALYVVGRNGRCCGVFRLDTFRGICHHIRFRCISLLGLLCSKNLVQVTVAISVARWWGLLPDSDAVGGGPCSDFCRACTKHLGSVAVGLFVAFLESVKWIARLLYWCVVVTTDTSRETIDVANVTRDVYPTWF